MKSSVCIVLSLITLGHGIAIIFSALGAPFYINILVAVAAGISPIPDWFAEKLENFWDVIKTIRFVK